jgi:hypothetical protein
MPSYDKLRGFVGQSLSGVKSAKRSFPWGASVGGAANVPGSLIVPFGGVLDAYLFAAGGASSTTVAGGGGEAVYILGFPVPALSTISYVLGGAPAGDGGQTTLSVNGQLIAVANGGLSNVNGGLGGKGGYPNSRPGGAAGQPGVNGGAAGNGGGSGGFRDLFGNTSWPLAGGNGGSANAGQVPGGGGGASGGSWPGGGGGLWFVLREV